MPGPWRRADAFELSGKKRRSVLTVEIDGSAVTAQLAWSKDGPAVVALDGEKPAYAADLETFWDGREALVLRGGRQLRVAFPDPLSRHLDADGASGEIAAPISGRVVEFAVVTGAQVARGDPLFSIEAMKMEHGIAAPRAGTVTMVRVAPGQQIAEGTVVVVIEAVGEAEEQIAAPSVN